MKTYQAWLVGLGVVCACLSSVQAETFIVGSSLLNGNFNAGIGGGLQDFVATPDWVNQGTNGPTDNATNDNLTFDGTRNAIIFDQAARVHGLDTGYTIQSGDVFNTNYVWRGDGATWDGPSDQIGVTLFTTSDDTIGGTRTNLVTNLSAPSPRAGRYRTTTSNAFYTAQVADVGKRLFVEVDGVDGNATDGFARLDNFELSTGSIGPATPVLEFNAALNPTAGTNLWEPNIDALGPSNIDSKPIEFFTFGSVTNFSPVNDSSFPGITASYSAGSQGRNFYDGSGNQNGPGITGQVGTSFEFRQSPVSLELWFKPDSLSGGDQVVGEWGGSGNGSYISLQDDVLTFHNTSQGNAVTLIAPALTAAEWTQVVATWDSGAEEAQLYVNGQLADSAAATTLNWWTGGNAMGLGQVAVSDVLAATNDLAINGPLATGAGSGEETLYPLAGELAIFRIYSKALDEARVEAAFDAIAASSMPGDFDGDGDIDGNDFLEWQRSDGTPGGLADWQNAYPTPLFASASAVPEPASAILLVFAAMIVMAKRRYGA